MHIVLSGELDLQRGGQTVKTASAGSIVDEMAMIDKAPRSGHKCACASSRR